MCTPGIYGTPTKRFKIKILWRRWIEFLYAFKERLTNVTMYLKMSPVCTRISIMSTQNDERIKNNTWFSLLQWQCECKSVSTLKHDDFWKTEWSTFTSTLYDVFDAPIIIKLKRNKSSHCCLVCFLWGNFHNNFSLFLV